MHPRQNIYMHMWHGNKVYGHEKIMPLSLSACSSTSQLLTLCPLAVHVTSPNTHERALAIVGQRIHLRECLFFPLLMHL